MCKPNRRSFIEINLKGLIGLSACMPLLSSCLSTANQKQSISWNQFNEHVKNVADQLNNDQLSQKDYLKLAAELSGQLNVRDQQLLEEYAKYKNRASNFPEIRKIHGKQTFQISLLEFEPGEAIYLHDHPGMTGVINCVEGSVHVINYDLLPKKASNNELLIKEVANTVMTPGDVSTLSANHRNIHWLKANTFSRMIDIFAPPYNRQRARDSKRFRITGTENSLNKTYRAIVV